MAKRLSVAIPPANSYPFPPFPKVILNAVVKAARRAWLPIAEEERACRHGEGRNEVQLNAEMAIEMDALRRLNLVRDFTADIFETPIADAPTRNFSGERIGTRPDITIRLRSLRPALANPMVDAVFIECKCLRESQNLGPYFKDGMRRFIDGDYGWAVQQAIMVGYLETGQVLPEDLEKRLMRNGQDTEMNLVLDDRRRRVRPSGQRYLAFTRHQRIWRHQNDDFPGDIELLHVWLSRWE